MGCVAARDEVDRDHVGHEGDIGVLRGGGFERLLDRKASGIGHMDNPPIAVPALARQVQRVAFDRERNTQFDQMGDRARRRLDDMLDDASVVEPRAGDHGIVDVRLEAVAFVEHRGDPALRASRRAFAQSALGDHRDRVRFGEVERRRQPSRARADDEDIGGRAHAASTSAETRLRNTSSRSGSRVETSTIDRPSAASELSTWPAFTWSLR